MLQTLLCPYTGLATLLTLHKMQLKELRPLLTSLNHWYKISQISSYWRETPGKKVAWLCTFSGLTHYSSQFSFGFSSHHAVHKPLWYLGLAFSSHGLFLFGTMVAFCASSIFSIKSSTFVSFRAKLIYSQGSSSMLKRQGPSLTPHSAGSGGGGPHVTTAFLRVGWVLDTLRGCCAFFSKPGGGYHPSWP